MKYRAPLLLVLTIVLFHWKLWLTNQYTWLESTDLVSQVLPAYEFSSYELHKGRLPLWDPYTFGGQPLHAGMQASLAYPPHWLLMAAPLKKNSWLLGNVMNCYYILIRCLVALGMYALCRDLGRSAWAACLAGVIYSLGGVEVTTDWPQMAHAAAWAPITFLFLFRMIRCEPALLRNAILGGASLGAAWLCGHHAYPTFISLTAAGLWLYWLKENRAEFQLTNLVPPALFFLFAALIGAVQLLPTAEYSPLSRRWVGLESPIRWNESIPYNLYEPLSLSADGMFAFIFPYTNQNYNPYLGICACALGLLGAAVAWRDRNVRILASIGLGGLIFALNSYTPVHGWLYATLEMVEKTRAPAMATILVSVAIAALAAYALDYLLQQATPVQEATQVQQAPAGQASACAELQLRPDGVPTFPARVLHPRSPWPHRFSLTLAIFGLLILILGSIQFARRAEIMNGPNTFLLTGFYALALALWLAAHSQLTQNWKAFCPIALVLIELTQGPSSLWRNQQDHSKPSPLTPLAEDYKMVDFIKSSPGSWRVETDVPYSFGTWWGLETIDGYVAAATSNILDQDLYSARFRQFMSVRYRVAEKPSNDQQKQVFEGPRGLKVFENPTWFPRAWMVHSAAIEPDPKQMSHRLTSPNFDPLKQVLLSHAAPTLESCDGTQDVARLGPRTPNKITITVDAACRGMLILNDVYYPGWRATIDKSPTPINEAYGVVRGVTVEKGKHTVVFEFSPASVKLGALLSVLGVVGACVAGFRAGAFKEQGTRRVS